MQLTLCYHLNYSVISNLFKENQVLRKRNYKQCSYHMLIAMSVSYKLILYDQDQFPNLNLNIEHSSTVQVSWTQIQLIRRQQCCYT
jgi:hypothetical protein